MAGTTPILELCAGTYRAQKVPGSVVIFADGVHPTTGFRTFWHRDTPDVFPPTFSLWHIRPDGVVLQVLTPFAVSTSFQTTQELARVRVHDVNGAHLVEVEQVPDLVVTHAR
jgi:hypothetical protein